MNILSSSSAFLPCFNKQGLFSSQSAFKKPKLPTTLNKPKQDYAKPLSFLNSNNLPNKQCKPIRLTQRNEDPELLICEPVKKVKLTQSQGPVSSTLNMFKPKETTVRPSQLTIEAVFNTPDEIKKGQSCIRKEDVFDDGSSLSFISSCSSLDDLEVIEEKGTGPEEKGEMHEEICFAMNPKAETHALLTMDEKAPQPLFVRDDYLNRLSGLNQPEVYSNNLTTPLIAFSIAQYNDIHPLQLLKNLQMLNMNTFPAPQQLGIFDQSFYDLYNNSPSNNIYQVEPTFYKNEEINFAKESLRVKEIEETRPNFRVNGKKEKINEEECYDSDGTRSTSVELSLPSDKSQKESSPPYTMNIDMCEGLKFQVSKENKEKKEKPRKPAKERSASKKEKKGRSLNLKMEINPKHLKLERRLNRLQLLRYQEDGVQVPEETETEKIETVSPVNKQVVEEIRPIEEQRIINPPVSERCQVVVPPFGFEARRRRMEAIAPVWTPEVMEDEQAEVYLQQLSEVVGIQVTDQQKSLKLLQSFNMNTSALLHAVKEDAASYKELFRVKARRHRRK